MKTSAPSSSPLLCFSPSDHVTLFWSRCKQTIKENGRFLRRTVEDWGEQEEEEEEEVEVEKEDQQQKNKKKIM